MSVVTLAEMTAEEFARRRAPMVREYARVTAQAGGLNVPEAEAMAEQETEKSLPQGPQSPGQLLRTAWVDGSEVGWIWVTLPDGSGPGLAWIADILVDGQHRSHGYAAAMIQGIEIELIELGVPRLGLNVFGYNDVARRLYERLGFDVIQWQMSRSLFGVPGTIESSVTLLPVTETELPVVLESFAAGMLADYPTLTPAEAEQRARQPLGTDGVHVSHLIADGVRIGWACYAERHHLRHGMGWIYRLELEPAYRGRGLGPAVVAVIEADLAARGVGSVGLSVPGSKPGESRLAERLGFEVMAQQMEKKLPAL